VLLELARLGTRVPAELNGDVLRVQDSVRACVEDVRRIAIELRPEALDDLGLASAMAVLCERFAERWGLEVTQRIAPELPELPPTVELVVYRVAQEALTNVARHSGADHAELTLTYESGIVRLTVSDRGRGLPEGHEPGTGIRGMRERATLIGAKLAVDSDPATGGCRVVLSVPTLELDVPVEEPR
jgi:two-component system sensor histidine kinase UhpB